MHNFSEEKILTYAGTIYGLPLHALQHDHLVCKTYFNHIRKTHYSRTGQMPCYVAWNPYRVYRLHNTCFMLPQVFYVVGT